MTEEPEKTKLDNKTRRIPRKKTGNPLLLNPSVQEAMEDFNIDNDVDSQEVEEPEGEDLLDNPDRDYQAIDELDKYEPGSQDEEEYDAMDQAQK